MADKKKEKPPEKAEAHSTAEKKKKKPKGSNKHGEFPPLDPKNRQHTKQIAFVQEYCKDYNGTQAAIRAGYSPRTANEQASGLLAKPNIKAAIREHLDKNLITAERVLAEYAKMAFADIGTYVRVKSNNEVVAVPFEALDAGATGAIKKVRGRTVITGSDDDAEVANVVEIELHDKLKALEPLARLHGLFDNSTTVKFDASSPLSLNVNLTDMTDDDLTRMIRDA